MNDRALTVADLAHTLTQMGWQPPAASGIAGNVQRETGSVALKPRVVGDNGNAIGLFQHNGPRMRALQEYARTRGKQWDDPLTQVQFMNHEVDTQYPDLRDRLNAISNPAQAASVFMNEFERPAERVRNAAIRGQFAQQIYGTLQRLSPVQEAQADEGLSLDDALSQVLGPPDDGSMSLDEALGQFMGGGEAPVADVPQATAPQDVLPSQSAIPIDPYAAQSPESPMQGDGRLTRDLVGMAEMAPLLGRGLPGPLNTARGAYLGLQNLFSRAPRQEVLPPAPRQIGHMESTIPQGPPQVAGPAAPQQLPPSRPMLQIEHSGTIYQPKGETAIRMPAKRYEPKGSANPPAERAWSASKDFARSFPDKGGHWSLRQMRDSLGRFAKKGKKE